MSELAAAAVEAGASLLDEEHPGWADEIRLGDLEVDNPAACVVGQLYGDDIDGAGFLSYAMGLEQIGTTEAEASFYGFAATEEDFPPEDEDYFTYDDLQPLWVRAIAARRKERV